MLKNPPGNRALFLTLAFFGILYSAISLVNHYNFRTYAYDLGLVNNAIYDYAHFRWNHGMLMQLQFKNILEDHFTLLQLILSPLYFVFGSYTMLIVQIVAILLGGLGTYRYFVQQNSPRFARIAMVHFLTAFGIFSALAFDYHDNVLAAMFVPWLFYYFKNEKWLKCSIVFVLILISKENMALWMGFIALGLVAGHFKEPEKRNRAAIYSVIAFLYFFVIVNYAMPSMAIEKRGYLHFTYSALGNSFGDAFMFLLQHPIKSIQLLFVNHLGNPLFDGVKQELHFMVIISGGYFLLIRPQYLLMLVPIYAQKLFNDDVIKWGISYHYSVEFAPILTFVLFSVLATVSSQRIKMTAAILACSVSVFFSIHKIDRRIAPFYDGDRHRFYKPSHYYNENLNVKEVNETLRRLIPPDAAVSAHQQVVPHLAFRDKIYLFPVIGDAEYIVLLNKQVPYPVTERELMDREKQLRSDTSWSLLYDQNNMLVFKRK
jgi:uncharacterized membrane protein